MIKGFWAYEELSILMNSSRSRMYSTKRGNSFELHFSLLSSFLCALCTVWGGVPQKYDCDKRGPTGIRTQVARIRTLSDNQLHYGTPDTEPKIRNKEGRFAIICFLKSTLNLFILQENKSVQCSDQSWIRLFTQVQIHVKNPLNS